MADRVSIELNEFDAHMVQRGLYELERSFKRKRSWRPSEVAASVASVRSLNRRIADEMERAFPGTKV